MQNTRIRLPLPAKVLMVLGRVETPLAMAGGNYFGVE